MCVCVCFNSNELPLAEMDDSNNYLVRKLITHTKSIVLNSSKTNCGLTEFCHNFTLKFK